MKQPTDGDGRSWLGSVVLDEDGRIGVVIDCWPLVAPAGLSIRWEPLLSGRVTKCVPSAVTRVPLETLP